MLRLPLPLLDFPARCRLRGAPGRCGKPGGAGARRAGPLASVPGAEALAALRLHRQPLPGVFSKRWSPSVLRRPPMPVCRAKPGTDTTSALAHGTGAYVGHYLELAPSPSAHLRGGFSGSSSEAIGKGIPAHCHGPRAGSGAWQCHFSTAWRVTDIVLEGCNHHPSCCCGPPAKGLSRTGGMFWPESGPNP